MTAAERTRRSLLLLCHAHVSRLSDRDRLAYAMGTLVCDDDGAISRTALDAALSDPAMVVSARKLLKRAGL